ncbi:MAG: dihydroneopterin aldolase [Candidatus Omnitrophota bacterium]
MLSITINDLKVNLFIGADQEERTRKQTIILNIELKYDAVNAIMADDLNQALDYRMLSEEITKRAENSQFFLLEKLVDFVLSIVMENKMVHEATVSAEKPNALRDAKSVTVKAFAKR